MKKRTVVAGIFLLLLSGLSHAQQRYELTVQQAVDLAYKNVIQLKNAQIDYRIQVAKNKEITGQALPQLSATAGANRYLQLPKFLFPDASQSGIYAVLIKEGLLPNTTEIPTPTLQQVSFQQPWNLNVGATLTQLLFQPDVFVGLQARRSALDYNTALIEQTREQIKDSAYKRYYAILIAQKQQAFLTETMTRLQKLYHDDSVMFKNGFAERLDLDKVQVQINNLQTNLNLVTSAVTLSNALLKFALGLSQKDTVVLKDELTNEAIKQGILEDSFRYEDRAEIRTLEVTRRLQTLDLKRYKLAYLPTVSLAGNYTITAMGQKFFTNPNTLWINSSYIGLNVNLPIFDGFQRKYKVQQSQLTLEKLDNTIENVKQGIDLEQVASKETLRTALSNLDIQERNLELAQRVYNMTVLKFQQGLGSSFEVLQSDTDYQQAQSNYFNALYNAVTARVSFLYSLGKL
jgi:outer membrane protein